MAGKTYEPKQTWMEGLAGFTSNKHRSRRIKSNIGVSHYGSLQKRSVITLMDQFNSVQAARDTISKSRHRDREKISQPPQIWYESLRSSSRVSQNSTGGGDYSHPAPKVPSVKQLQ